MRYILSLCLILGLFFLSTMNSKEVMAVEFTVNSTADIIDSNAGDGNCLTVGGDCTLRAAIMETNALSGTDKITVPAGTYTLSIAGTGEDAAAQGDLDITSGLTIVGAGVSGTTIDGGHMDRVMEVRAGAGTVYVSNLTIRNGYIAAGLDEEGAGLFNQDIVYLNHLRVTGNEISGTSSSDVGGGLCNNGGGYTMFVNNCTIDNNKAARGGGIFNGGSSDLYIRNSVINGNQAETGGGMTAYGTVNIINTTISGNTSTYSWGAGIAVGSSGQDKTFLNCTVAGNVAASGANGIYIFSGATAIFKNTIVANDSPNCQKNGTIVTRGHNLSTDSTCDLTDPSDLEDTDPMLGPLQDNGGPTYTHALLRGSPAINAGDNTGCPAIDQRGFPRRGICDIGAYEFQSISSPGVNLLLLEE